MLFEAEVLLFRRLTHSSHLSAMCAAYHAVHRAAKVYQRGARRPRVLLMVNDAFMPLFAKITFPQIDYEYENGNCKQLPLVAEQPLTPHALSITWWRLQSR